jgi:hypothetical protein
VPRARDRVERVSEIAVLRTPRLELHCELLEAQRIKAERFGGRMSKLWSGSRGLAESGCACNYLW